MIREDRLLLVDLARLNTDVVPLAMRIIDESATAEEHFEFATRLAEMARRLQARALRMTQVIDGELALAVDDNVTTRSGTVVHRNL